MNRERLRNRLILDEGNVPHAYQDSEGYLTIGVGRLIDRSKGGGLSESEIRYLLDNDIDKVIATLEHTLYYFPDLDDVRQEVLINMGFNLGVSGLLKFKKTLAYIEQEKWKEASVEMLNSKWADQVGHRAVRLSNAMRDGEWMS